MRYALLIALLLPCTCVADIVYGGILDGGQFYYNQGQFYFESSTQSCPGCGRIVKTSDLKALVIPYRKKDGQFTYSSITLHMCPKCAGSVTYGGKPLKQPSMVVKYEKLQLPEPKPPKAIDHGKSEKDGK